MAIKKSDDAITRQGKYHMTNKEFNHRVPSERPKFTLDDIKNAIPKHCFERPLYKTLYYISHDFLICSVIFFISLFIQQFALKTSFLIGSLVGYDITPLHAIVQSSILKDSETPAALFSYSIPSVSESAMAFFAQSPIAALSSGAIFTYNTILSVSWIAYALLQGVFMTGLWVIGHEAGHNAVHKSRHVCDAIGLVLHSLLLVPYHSWRISHRNHHSHTGDMELDEVHLPFHVNALFPSAAHGYLHNDKWDKEKDMNTIEQLEKSFVVKASLFVAEMNSILKDVNPLYRSISGFFMGAIGWLLYLFINASGRRFPDGSASPNHFNPNSPVFKKSESHFVWISNVGLICAVVFFYKIVEAYGMKLFTLAYIAPYFVTNYWLVVITFLQHTHPALPHFSTQSWNYVQGSLSTIDRSYGAFLNYAFHNIQDTHVTHHVISYIPHYNAMEATNAIKKVIGDYYVSTDSEARWFGCLRAVWYSLTHLNYVSEDNHPAMVLCEEAIEATKRGDNPEKAVEAKRMEALSNGPHINGRDVSKEVYWFRSLNYE